MALLTRQIGRSTSAAQDNMPPTRPTLSTRVRGAVAAAAAIDLVIGLAFLLWPELGPALWPTAIAPILMASSARSWPATQSVRR